jgi:hypothetical protein
MSCSVSPEDRLEIRRLSLVNVIRKRGGSPPALWPRQIIGKATTISPALLAGALDVPNHRLSASFTWTCSTRTNCDPTFLSRRSAST